MSSLLTESELIQRVQMMRPGEKMVYFRGHLSEAAFFNPQAARLRDAAQRLSNMRMLRPSGDVFVGMGLVTLSQIRSGDAFVYIATKLR